MAVLRCDSRLNFISLRLCARAVNAITASTIFLYGILPVLACVLVI